MPIFSLILVSKIFFFVVAISVAHRGVMSLEPFCVWFCVSAHDKGCHNP